ncbi:MAG TPA: hypothetical protein VEU97_16760 [Ktedonobacteraceae bacterium]|nr:hypothetical protein [Ktedonobacteraceae bacterium]
MLKKQDNKLPITSHHTRLPTLASADEEDNTRQPALVLQAGSDLDLGLERKHRNIS